MKKGHFDSKTGGNGFFSSKNEISLLRPAINEWRPKNCMTIEDGGEWTDDSGINDGSKTYLLLENCLSFQQTDDTQRDDISYFESQDKSDE